VHSMGCSVCSAWCPLCMPRCAVRGDQGAVPGARCAQRVVPGVQGRACVAWCPAWRPARCPVRGAQHARHRAGSVECSTQRADLSLPLALSGGQEGKCCRSRCFHRRSGTPKPAQILISVGKKQQGLLSPWSAGDAFYFHKLYRSPQPLIKRRK